MHSFEIRFFHENHHLIVVAGVRGDGKKTGGASAGFVAPATPVKTAKRGMMLISYCLFSHMRYFKAFPAGDAVDEDVEMVSPLKRDKKEVKSRKRFDPDASTDDEEDNSDKDPSVVF